MSAPSLKVWHQIKQTQAQVRDWKQQGLKVGFVPTMGNLHAGHLSLVEQAQQQADKVVVSIFVNPLQFGVGEDFERYPRTLVADEALLAQQGCDLLFAPSVSEMYPSKQAQPMIQVPSSLADKFEGQQRPGHFDGVATVVAKLFNAVQPDVAVFGQKDYQQWCVLSQMVSGLNWPITMIKAPIVRDSDGLALSSRNQYLTATQRRIAPNLFRTLQDLAQDLAEQRGQIQHLLHDSEQKLLQLGFDQVDYIELVDKACLETIKDYRDFSPEQGVLLVAARLGMTRLLDNYEWITN